MRQKNATKMAIHFCVRSYVSSTKFIVFLFFCRIRNEWNKQINKTKKWLYILNVNCKYLSSYNFIFLNKVLSCHYETHSLSLSLSK